VYTNYVYIIMSLMTELVLVVIYMIVIVLGYAASASCVAVD
jgi:hypothetical protein